MTDELNNKKIARLLTQSARQLDPGTLAALGNARQKALQRQTARVPVFTFATSRWVHFLVRIPSHQWAPAGLIAAMLVFGVGYWHHAQEQQIAEIDVAILTDELPIEVFVD
ncbi:MAG: DUF3619 family protein [Gallionella sp.]|nr:DUF3619 family protein [Gallionella sp.]